MVATPNFSNPIKRILCIKTNLTTPTMLDQTHKKMAPHPILLLLFSTFLLLPPTNAQLRQQNLPAQFLGPQNAARSSIGLPPLTWDPRLARYAEQYARFRKRDCALVHSNGPYGENIFWGSGTGWTPAQAVAMWMTERRWYHYRTNSCVQGDECGHYTQIVWRSSRRVGCAMVGCSGRRGEFVVCNYDPPGNYVGEKPY